MSEELTEMTTDNDNDPVETSQDVQDQDFVDSADHNDGAEVPEEATQAQPATQLQEPKVLQIPTTSMKRIKEEERQRGRANVITELNLQAKQLGFRSHEDMLAQAARFRERNKPQTPTTKPEGDATERESPRKLNAMERDVARLNDERKRQNRRITDLEKENKKLKTQLDSQETESTLRVSAARHGVRDVDYALHVCRAHCARLKPEQLESFNEDKFFGETLKTSHSYLYNAEDRPATTTPVTAVPPGRPAAPTAAPVSDPAMVGVDATKLSPEQYRALLKERGLSDPLVTAYAG